MKNTTEITPILRIVTPKYPDQYAVDLKPFLLNNKPLRWQAVPIAGTVLSAVVMLGLAGCVTAGVPAPPPLIEVPLFEHGEGRGVYGCVAIAAPVFLSEEDAFAIVREEFAKIDLSVQLSDRTVTGVSLPRWEYPDTDSFWGELGAQQGSFTFDFVVEGSGIEMEFVSTSDLWEWNALGDRVSISTYECKGSAEILNDSLNKKRNLPVHGVFYDPMEMVDMYSAEDWSPLDNREAVMEAARARSLEMLRLQVQDFIAWLAAQGII
ncbi:MAG: hypothetical protein FWF10_11510 [Clostridiales bacterium]|nr:hypothetical protein [Clostridiales bacterium]